MADKKRRNFKPKEKVAILKQHLIEKKPISDICDTHGIKPYLFYRWQKDFFDNGGIVFHSKNDSKNSKLEKKVAQLEGKLIQKNEVISELMEAHIALKKNLGEN